MEKKIPGIFHTCAYVRHSISALQNILKKYESLFYSRKLDELFGGWKGSRGIGQY